jgi:hypothetical protein
MKYPIAVVSKLLEAVGANIAVGYDIGCAFSKTLENSSLGPRVKALAMRCIVGGFHGYSHNLLCQLDWHPLYVKGAGKEDFEGCERAFSASNALAGATRLASPFHRAQAIEQHFLFWNEDKYANSGKQPLVNLAIN